jgi:hypothetical protein
MEFLAPSSGYKQGFDAKFLADRLKSPLDDVEAELKRLSGVNVLRTRQYGDGPFLYELCHDSLITIIAPWRKKILRRARFWLWGKRTAIGAAIIIILVFLSVIGKDLHDLRQHTVAMVTDPKKKDAEKFKHAAYYLLETRGDSRFELWGNELFKYWYGIRGESSRFDILKELLKTNVRKNYGLNPN